MSGLSMAGIMLRDSAKPARPLQSPEKTKGCSENLLRLVDCFLEALAGRESGQRFGADLDFLAVRGAASGARLSLPGQERSEPDHGHPLAFRDIRDDRVEQRVHSFSCGRLADV